MTQLEGAVGGASDTTVAVEPTLTDRLSAVMDEPQGEEKKPEEAAEGDEGAALELTTDDLGDADAGDEAGELPPIAPPVSWKADEQEEFKQLPRALQETLTRREAEREKFVQTKSQEATSAYSRAQQEAIAQVQSIAQQHAQAFQEVLPHIPERPSYQLQVDDPIAFADQMDAHERALAQHSFVQQRIQQARQQAQQAEELLRAESQKEFHTVLSQEYPEFLDPATGPKLREQLGSTALALGYPAESLADVDARDVKAMRLATDWKAKADKYDALMAKKMENVRAARGLPRVSRPGVPQGKGAQENARYAADRQAMRNGDKDAAARAIARFL